MVTEYLPGMLRITNFLIALFVLFYAFLFLIKTTKRNERRPWDYLFLSALIFMFYQLFSMIMLFSGKQSPLIDDSLLRVFLEFLFSGLVLLAFVSQHDLILKSPLILISRKIDLEAEKKEKKKPKKGKK